MTDKDKINLENFRREIELKKLQEQERDAEFTDEFPLEELKALLLMLVLRIIV